MRILNVIQCTNLGGMEQVSLLMMKGLVKLGHDCSLVSLNPIGALGPALAAEGIPCQGLEYRGLAGWRSLPALRRTLRASCPEAVIVIGHNMGAMLAIEGLCPEHRLLAVHFHHTGVKPDWQWRLVYRFACKRFRAITFPSDFIRHEAIRIHPPVERLGYTVRNPVVMPKKSNAEDKLRSRTELGLPRDAKIVGNAGWLIPRKRFDVFLRVAALVAKQVPESFFVIGGDGQERARLEALADELGISSRVRWLGWIRDMSSFYQALDVLLFNSDGDAMGMTAIEAMAYSLPVVASTTLGGLGEVLDDSCGFFTDRHNIELLAERITALLADSDLCEALGRQGRARIGNWNSVDEYADRMAKLLGMESCAKLLTRT